MGKLHDWAGCGHEYKADELFFAQSRMKCHAISKLAHAGLLVDRTSPMIAMTESLNLNWSRSCMELPITITNLLN